MSYLDTVLHRITRPLLVEPMDGNIYASPDLKFASLKTLDSRITFARITYWPSRKSNAFLRSHTGS